jgi:hypothetical protein
MGKTVESYRLALDEEIRGWNSFSKALRSEDREAFDALMDACRGYAAAGSNAVRPLLFEPMVMSILLSQQIRLQRIQKELDAFKEAGNSGPC